MKHHTRECIEREVQLIPLTVPGNNVRNVGRTHLHIGRCVRRILATPAGHVKSLGLVAAGVHWYANSTRCPR